MKICSQCHDEYRDDITTCLQCGIELVGHLDRGAIQGSSRSVDLHNAVKGFEGQLSACQKIEKLLKHNKVPCCLVPVSSTAYAVCINAGDAQTYASVMNAQFASMVEREHDQEWRPQDVHLDGSDVCCPACGHVGQLQDGQCSDCGLMLDVNEPSCGR